MSMFDRVERTLLDNLIRKYVLKLRNNELNRIIREKCSELYEQRKNIKKELNNLKESLLLERDPKKVQEIQNRIYELMIELDKIESEIKNKAKIELNIKEEIKNELNNIERDIRNKVKALIDLESDVRKPVREAIEKEEPSLALVVFRPDEGVEPKGVIVVKNRPPVPGKGGGGV